MIPQTRTFYPKIISIDVFFSNSLFFALSLFYSLNYPLWNCQKIEIVKIVKIIIYYHLPEIVKESVLSLYIGMLAT